VSRPLVSIITGTWQRHDLLLEAIANVREQTYRPLEHVIVSDGPDPTLADLMERERRRDELRPMVRGALPVVPIRFVECGRHWTGELSDSYAAAPFMVGQMLARGEYACLWADDERAEPDHLEKMVDLIEATEADFVFPYVRFWWKDRPDQAMVIGADPPVLGSITHWLYRPSMIEKARGPYRTHVGRANDWEFIERAMRGGATWAMLPEVTFSHRADD
jgi:GT2 family glycosyltransferase